MGDSKVNQIRSLTMKIKQYFIKALTFIIIYGQIREMIDFLYELWKKSNWG